MTDSNQSVTTKQANPFDTLLAQSRDLVCERLTQAMSGMLDKAPDTLSAMSIESQDRDVRALYLETRDMVLGQRKAIEEMFRVQYLREFQARSNRMKKIGQSFSDFDSSSLELDLVGEDDLNETLKVNDMATKLRRYCDDELAALDQRVGVLLGDANLESEDNPFSPQAICDAFKLTCRNLVPTVNVRMVLLRLFDDHVLDDIRSVYKAVNALLVQNSILPKIRFGVSRGKDGGKAPTPGEEPPAVAAQLATGGEPDFFAVLQKLLVGNLKTMTQPGPTEAAGTTAGSMPAMPAVSPTAGTPGFGPTAGMPGMVGTDGSPVVVLQGPQLMDFLTRVQHGESKAGADGAPAFAASAGAPVTANVLRELKNTSLGTGMNQLDSMTLDIVAMLFDQLFDDPKIPIAVKGLIGRMQIPILKVAIADKDFFSRKSHPARRMMDTLGEISLRLPADFNASNPLFGRLEVIIQELINGFEDNVEVFDSVREKLQILTAEEDERVEQETQVAAEQIEQKEHLSVSKTMAEFEVRVRAQAWEIPRPVLDFLVQEWVKVLLMLHAKHGQHSDPWKNALATMDLLIWSIKAKETPEERSRLTAEMPMLLRRLAAGLKIAGVDDAVGASFFSDLSKLHADAMRMDTEGEAVAGHDADAAINSAILDSAPGLKPLPVPDIAMPSPVPDIAMPSPALDITMPSPAPDVAMPAPVPDIAIPWLPPDTTIPLPVPSATISLPVPDVINPAPALDAMKPVRTLDATIPLPAFDATNSLQTPGAIKPVQVPDKTIPLPAPNAVGLVPAPSAASPVVPAPVATKPVAAPTVASPVVPAPVATKPVPAPSAASPIRAPAATGPVPARVATRPVPAPGVTRPVPAPGVTRPVPAPEKMVKSSTAARPRPAAIAIPDEDSNSLDFTAVVTVRNPFGKGKVEVKELDFTDPGAPSTAPAKGGAKEAEFVNNIKEGTWVEFREGEQDKYRPARLSYISPLKNSYLFVDRLGETVKECSRAELSRLFSIGKVVVMDEVPLFERMMKGLVGKLS
jgi:hypothetical protein